MSRIGTLTVVVGSMFSGKSEKLIRLLKKARYAKKSVVAFKPMIDTRYAPDKIVSHEGETFHATRVSSATDITALSTGADVVGIDEIQFMEPDIVEAIFAMIHRGQDVYVAGLDMDYQGVPFGVVPELLARADFIEKRQAVCTTCGAAAVHSQRIIEGSEQVLVGGRSAYEARCRRHWSPTET